MDRAVLLEETVERLAFEEVDLVSILSQAVALAGSDRQEVTQAAEPLEATVRSRPIDPYQMIVRTAFHNRLLEPPQPRTDRKPALG